MGMGIVKSLDEIRQSNETVCVDMSGPQGYVACVCDLCDDYDNQLGCARSSGGAIRRVEHFLQDPDVRAALKTIGASMYEAGPDFMTFRDGSVVDGVEKNGEAVSPDLNKPGTVAGEREGVQDQAKS